MAGVAVDSGSGKRRPVDMEINMVPMIDLLMVTVSFLLITAVWTHMSRMDATTRVPGPADPTSAPAEQVARIHVAVPSHESPFVLSVKRGTEVLATANVPRERVAEISAKLEDLESGHAIELASADSHIVVLHTDDELRYADMIAVMDAIAAPKDPRGHHGESAFRVNLATK